MMDPGRKGNATDKHSSLLVRKKKVLFLCDRCLRLRHIRVQEKGFLNRAEQVSTLKNFFLRQWFW
jgi:hypothetical protein